MLVVSALAAGGAAGFWLAKQAAPPPLQRATLLPSPRPLPPMALLRDDGSPFNRDSLAGRWTLVFFGFTNCPGICPATMATLAAVRGHLQDLPEALQPAVVMITVDPDRDTPETLAGWLRRFDPSFVGVTGDAEAIDDLSRRLGVAVRAGLPDDAGGYDVDHTSAVFLIDPEASFAALFGSPHQAELIARDFRSIVGRRG